MPIVLIVAMIALPLLIFASVYSPPSAPDTIPAAVSYNIRAPIVINGDLDFTAANGVTGGNGTPGDPYIIEGWDIDASGGHAISITGTTDYFIIRDCYLHDGRTAGWDGIIMSAVMNGVVRNNTIINNNHGIHLDECTDNRLVMNDISNNGLDAIYLDDSHENYIENNSCTSNSWNGVFLSMSTFNAVLNNTCLKNEWDGIYLEASSNNQIWWNNCSENVDDGIELFWNSDDNDMYQNVVMNNQDYGGAIDTSFGNIFHENTFMFNRGSLAYPAYSPMTIQGYDNTGANAWDDGVMVGNYWHDWTGPDADMDGIVDNPYLLDPGLMADNFPLVNWVVIPEFSGILIPIVGATVIAVTASRAVSRRREE